MCALEVSDDFGLPKFIRLLALTFRTRILTLLVLLTVPLQVGLVVVTCLLLSSGVLLSMLLGMRIKLGPSLSGLIIAWRTAERHDRGRLSGNFKHLLNVKLCIRDMLTRLSRITCVSDRHVVSGSDLAVSFSIVPGPAPTRLVIEWLQTLFVLCLPPMTTILATTPSLPVPDRCPLPRRPSDDPPVDLVKSAGRPLYGPSNVT